MFESLSYVTVLCAVVNKVGLQRIGGSLNLMLRSPYRCGAPVEVNLGKPGAKFIYPLSILLISKMMENHQPVTAIQSTSLHIWQLFITYCNLDSMPIVLHHHLTGPQVIIGEDPVRFSPSVNASQIDRRL